MSTLAKKRFRGIDYEFRPPSYWGDEADPLTAILRNVNGRNRRRMIRDYWEQGRLDQLDESLLRDELDEVQRDRLGLIHPSFMGGEYLPAYLPLETEIARIELESTTADVISIRARPAGKDRIHYRIVDEYDSEFRIDPEQSPAPLSLEEMVRLIDGVNDGEDGGLGICYNRGNLGAGADADGLRHFTTVTSDLYPDLFAHYDALHDYWVRGVKFFSKAAANSLIPFPEENTES